MSGETLDGLTDAQVRSDMNVCADLAKAEGYRTAAPATWGRLSRICRALLSVRAAIHRDDPEKKALVAALEEINIAACYASEEDTDAARDALLHIGALAREAVNAAKVKP